VLTAVQSNFKLIPGDNTDFSLTIVAGPRGNGQISWTIYVKVMNGQGAGRICSHLYILGTGVAVPIAKQAQALEGKSKPVCIPCDSLCFPCFAIGTFPAYQ